MQLALEGDIHVIVTRTFKAPPAHVYRTPPEPDLIRQWMLGMPRWSMPVSETDPNDGGTFRFEWDCGISGGFADQRASISS